MPDHQGKRDRSFTDFQSDFFQVFGDAKVFDCLDFNLVKVVQDGLKLRYDFRTFWGLPLWIFRIILLLRQWSTILRGKASPFEEGRLSELKGRDFLLLDPGRYVRTTEGNWTSVYFHRWLKSIPKSKRVFGLERVGKEEKIPYDFSVNEYTEGIAFLPLTTEDTILYKALRQKLHDWKVETNFSKEELAMVNRSLEIFWNHFRLWNYLLQHLQPKQALFTCHYHKEGLLLALKRLKIKSIELQHGLIAAEDIFYVYPEKIAQVSSRALFADEIWTYGTYWREVLLKGCEYQPEQIKVIGYYLYEKENRDEAFIQEIKTLAAGAPILLITTQTLLYQTFIDYVESIVSRCQAEKIPAFLIVKPHPANKEGTYQQLTKLPGVLVSRADLYDLFSASDLHLSIYSTTLYEATRLGLPNFALYVDSCSDYIDSILHSGVAERLEWDENPFFRPVQVTDSIRSEEYFAPFSFTQLTAILS